MAETPKARQSGLHVPSSDTARLGHLHKGPMHTGCISAHYRLATENPRWGYGKIQGELIKLGHTISRSSVRHVLARKYIPPAHRRGKDSSSWRTFLGHYTGQILACDSFTVETIRLQTLYVFFFIEIGTRRVHFAGCTAHPTSTWVTQQARNIVWDIREVQTKELPRQPMLFLIHDRDAKFTSSFNTVFVSEGIEIIHAPYRAPKANAFAERWVRSAREECLDLLLIISESHLRRVLIEYIQYYNSARPHQGIGQRIPGPKLLTEKGVETGDAVHHRNVLGGIIHDYYRTDSKAA